MKGPTTKVPQTAALSWAYGLLDEIGGARTATTVEAVVAWEKAESGSNPTFRGNPLNVTLLWPGGVTPARDKYPGKVTYPTAKPLEGNSTGVAVFASPTTGIKATALRLTTPFAAPILAQLKKGTTTAALSKAVASTAWGTGTFAGGGSGSSGGTSGGTGSGSTLASSISPLVSQASSLVSNANTLTHDAAVVLDRAFGMFSPGQGIRIGVAAGSVAAGVSGLRSWRQATSEQGGGSFPLAVALIGLAVLGAFIALRPWPQVNGKPIEPGAYAVDVLEGKPPKVTETTHTAGVTAIQAGIDSLLVLWALGKVASAFSAVTGAVRGVLGGGGGAGGGGGDTADAGGAGGDDVAPPLDPTPPIDVGGG